MNPGNRIIFELHPEDRARLDAIIAKLDNMQPLCDDCVDNVLHLVEPTPAPAPAARATAEPEPAVEPTPAPAPAARATAEPEPAVEPTPEPVAEPPSLAEFQKAVAVRCTENPALKPKVRELVNKYAPSVSEIPADKRHEFLTQLAAL